MERLLPVARDYWQLIPEPSQAHCKEQQSPAPAHDEPAPAQPHTPFEHEPEQQSLAEPHEAPPPLHAAQVPLEQRESPAQSLFERHREPAFPFSQTPEVPLFVYEQHWAAPFRSVPTYAPAGEHVGAVHVPFEQVDPLPVHVVQAFPPTPQALAELPDSHWFPLQQPLPHEFASHTHAPEMHSCPHEQNPTQRPPHPSEAPQDWFEQLGTQAGGEGGVDEGATRFQSCSSPPEQSACTRPAPPDVLAWAMARHLPLAVFTSP